MTRKSISKIYQKFVTTKDDFKRFELVDRLKDEECRELLLKMAFNYLSDESPTASPMYEVMAISGDETVDRCIGTKASVLAFINQYQHLDQLVVTDEQFQNQLTIKNGEIAYAKDKQLFVDCLTILQRSHVMSQANKPIREA